MQLRSNPPQRDDDGRSYYELIVRRGGEIALTRYRKENGGARQQIAGDGDARSVAASGRRFLRRAGVIVRQLIEAISLNVSLANRVGETVVRWYHLCNCRLY